MLAYVDGNSVHHSAGEGAGSGATDNGCSTNGPSGVVIETGYTLTDANGCFRDRGNAGRSECHRLIFVTYDTSTVDGIAAFDVVDTIYIEVVCISPVKVSDGDEVVTVTACEAV